VQISSLVKYKALSKSLVVVGDGLLCIWGFCGSLLQDQPIPEAPMKLALSPNRYTHKTYLSPGSKIPETNGIASDHRDTTLPYIEMRGYDSWLLPISRQDKQLWWQTFGDNDGNGANVTELHRGVPAPPLPVAMIPLGRRPVSALPHKRASSGSVPPNPAVRPAS